jgi:hypothetical protein
LLVFSFLKSDKKTEILGHLPSDNITEIKKNAIELFHKPPKECTYCMADFIRFDNKSQAELPKCDPQNTETKCLPSCSQLGATSRERIFHHIQCASGATNPPTELKKRQLAIDSNLQDHTRLRDFFSHILDRWFGKEELIKVDLKTPSRLFTCPVSQEVYDLDHSEEEDITTNDEPSGRDDLRKRTFNPSDILRLPLRAVGQLLQYPASRPGAGVWSADQVLITRDGISNMLCRPDRETQFRGALREVDYHDDIKEMLSRIDDRCARALEESIRLKNEKKGTKRARDNLATGPPRLYEAKDMAISAKARVLYTYDALTRERIFCGVVYHYDDPQDDDGSGVTHNNGFASATLEYDSGIVGPPVTAGGP